MRHDLGQEQIYLVVANYEDDHSILASGAHIPDGWKAVGRSGTKADCLKYVSEMRTGASASHPREPCPGGSGPVVPSR